MISQLLQKTFIHNIVQIIICISLLANIYFMYYQWNSERITTNRTAILKKLKNSNNAIADQSEYYQTNQYKEKIYKEQGYAKNGEQVYLTGVFETPLELNETTYVPNLIHDDKTNINKWFDCLFLGSSKLENVVYPNCK